MGDVELQSTVGKNPAYSKEAQNIASNIVI